jgi:hypothetical protein
MNTIRRAVFPLLCALAAPLSVAQQGSIISNGQIYLYNNESERRMAEALIRQRSELESIKARNYEWREPTPQEIAALENEWKEKNKFRPTHAMPDFSTRKIRVDKTEELSLKLAETESRLRELEYDRVQESHPSTPPPAPALPAPSYQLEAAAYNAAFSASEAKANALYPFTSDLSSAGAKRMIEIDNALSANGDPLFADPNKPLIVAQMVAKELRIAPQPKANPNGKFKEIDALTMLHSKARAGDANAQYDLGCIYEQGRYVAKDYAEAVKWYRLAAQQGLAVAQLSLSVMYSNGWGVAKDEVEAERLKNLFRAHYPTY